jgi:C-terminal processing protease CtpA/Prc
VWYEPHPANRYTNPIVVLIDERAQSAAEHFCINLKNARRATFVGSITAGANGDVTRINLPSGGSMTFTGWLIKFADGSRFQNIGIVPDVKVEPTIRGVRAGRDEVLERGLEVLRSLL